MSGNNHTDDGDDDKVWNIIRKVGKIVITITVMMADYNADLGACAYAVASNTSNARDDGGKIVVFGNNEFGIASCNGNFNKVVVS